MARWQLIETVTLEKPVEGEPCNGCGLCCIAEVCELGATLGDDQRCKALVRNADGTFACGLIVDPYRFIGEDRLAVWKRIDKMIGTNAGEQALRNHYAQTLGAGRGCDSDDAAVREFLAEAGRSK